MLKRNWKFIFSALVAIVDFIIFNFAFILSYYLIYNNPFAAFLNWNIWVFIDLLFYPIAISVGLYRGIYQISLGSKKPHLIKFTVYLGLLLMSFLFLSKSESITPNVIIIFLGTQYFLLTINHYLLFRLNKSLVNNGYGSKNTIIVGSEISVFNFAEHLKDIFGNHYNIKGFISNGAIVLDPVLKEVAIGNYKEIDTLITKYKIEQVFIVSKSMLEAKYNIIREACEKHGIKVKMVSPYINNLMRKFNIYDVTGVPLTSDQEKLKYIKLKKSFDRIITLCLGVITIPLSLIIAILIKLTSRGPVFFRQYRSLYKNGPVIRIYKFRTMYDNADSKKNELLESNITNGALFKIKNDPRITPIGKILRKYSLDELPQFINVLKGEMSLVGPRPLPVEDYDMIKNEKMNHDWYKKRGLLKPGITGLWQVSGRSNISFEEMCLLDLYYIENQSLLFDIEIMFDTIPAMIFGKGAY
ncbi:MAG: sugar transferase [Calditrichaceae bacterium]|nr:sugar transferase [Calditrichaceae bacterium]